MGTAAEIRDANAPGTGLAAAQQNGLKDIVSMPGNSVGALLQTAIERGASVEQLEKLVGLYERMEERQARQEFVTAIAAFQEECKALKNTKTAEIKTSTGAQFSYTYAPLDEIARQVNPILAKHGLSYNWDSSADKELLTVVCTVSHIAGHSVRSAFTLPTANNSAASPQQKFGSALTFAQRRSLSAALGLTTTDDDTDAAGVDPTPVSDDQVTHIDDLLREIGANRVKFLKYMGVSAIAEIRAIDYNTALAAIDDYRAAKEARKSGAP